MNNKNALLPLVVWLMALAFVAASVFVYYPLIVEVSPVRPPIVFGSGSNAGQPDLGPANTITVQLGSNKTSAAITIHPTYNTTYYKNVTIINNTDTKAYNVSLRVLQAITNFPPGSAIELRIYEGGANRTTDSPIATVDLLSTGTTYIGSLSGGRTWEVDVKVYIPQGSSLPSSATARLHLIYTPSDERPPWLP